jgi:hypothetical protein
VTIRAGYAASLLELEGGTLSYQAGEGSLVTTLVREAIAAEVLPEHSRRLFIGQLEDRLRALGMPVPDDLEAQFNQLAGLSPKTRPDYDVVYVGAPVDPPALSYLMSDYAMEVFFLSIYAVLGSLMLSGQAIRRRLAATRDGLLLDYALSVLSVYLVGLSQILFYTLTMSGPDGIAGTAARALPAGNLSGPDAPESASSRSWSTSSCGCTSA